jgi:hypothetical protein
MIHNILGEDAKIFDPTEEPKASELYKRINKLPEEEESFLTKLRKVYDQIVSSYPDIEKKLEKLPHRIKTAKSGQKNELLVFVKRGEDLFVGYKSYDEEKPRFVSFEEVYEKIVANPEEKALPLSKNFWDNYHTVLNKNKYKQTSKPNNPNQITNEAIKLLNDLLKNKYDNLKDYYSFISDLIEDITKYGTLSEYAISKIVEWEKFIKDDKKLINAIENLKREVGEDFLEKVLKRLEDFSEEIIISIENQVTEGKDEGRS